MIDNNYDYYDDFEFMLALVGERRENWQQLVFEVAGERRCIYIRKTEYHAMLWLANLLEVKPGKVLEVFFAIHRGEKMHNVHFKNKTGGGKRKIVAPTRELKFIQKQINTKILKQYPRSPYSFGFAGGSTEQALRTHLDSGCLLMVDIKNAFPSVKWKHVCALFKRLGFSWYISNFLADVATYEGCLTQGSPMSPLIFELICVDTIDRYAAQFARDVRDVCYTRYADNLFFSIPENDFSGKMKRELFREICSTNKNNSVWPNFQFHEFRVKKFSGNAVSSLGLVIHDEEIYNKREFKRRFRKAIHHAQWCLKNNHDLLPEAWGKLRGLFSYAQKETLPAKLRSDYEALKNEILNLEIDLTV